MTSTFENIKEWLKNSKGLKISLVGILILILLIPKEMIRDLVSERNAYRNKVIEEICSKWANAQVIKGPVISVPVKLSRKDTANPAAVGYIHFLPEELKVSGNLSPEIRYRGIYKVILYNSKISLKGYFKDFSFKEMNISPADIMWDQAILNMGISDLRGIKTKMLLNWDQQKIEMNPGVPSTDISESGVSAPVHLTDSIHSFSIDINLNGSESIYFAPMGKETSVAVTSPWNNPSFDGAFLPDWREITGQGFKANWHILHLNRNFPQKWLGNKYKIEGSEFGIKLMFPVDHYQKTDRSIKYSIMFISLTFIIFFFLEIYNKRKIHIIQYLLIGLALIIFYTLLLSFSEQFNFTLAYIISALATVILITLYSLSIFKNKFQTLLLGGLLSLLYGFLFTILQMEEYSLMIGSLGVFMILAFIMFMSKKIEWN